jgi:hypothetical protein
MGARRCIRGPGPLLGLLLMGCASTQSWVAQLPCEEPELRAVSGARVVAYTTGDGIRHPFEGRGWVSGEQVILVHEVERPRNTEVAVGTKADSTIVLARSNVRSLEVSRMSPPVAFGLGFLSGVAAIVVGLFVAWGRAS